MKSTAFHSFAIAFAVAITGTLFFPSNAEAGCRKIRAKVAEYYQETYGSVHPAVHLDSCAAIRTRYRVIRE